MTESTTDVSTVRVTIWLAIDSMVRAGAGLVAGVLVARHLGPEGYGSLAVAVTVVTVLGPIGGLGTDSLLVQRLATLGPTSPEAYTLLRAASQLRAAGCLITVVTALLFAAFRDPTEAAVVLLVAPALLAAPFESGWSWLLAHGRVQGAVTARVVATLVFAGLRILAVLLGGGVLWFAALTGVDILLQAAIAALAAKHQGARLSVGHSPRLLLRDSLPLLAGGLFFLLMLRIDVVFIDALLGSEATGQYSAATRFAEATYLLAPVIVGAAAPRIATRYAIDSPEYRVAYRNLLRFLLVGSVLIATALSFAAYPLIDVLLGEAFEPAVPVLIVSGWSAVAIYAATARERLVADYDITRTTLLNTAVGATANVALNLTLLPLIGIVGASIATVVAYTLAVFIVPLFDPRQRPVNSVMATALPWK